jgi:hypothetical protein
MSDSGVKVCVLERVQTLLESLSSRDPIYRLIQDGGGAYKFFHMPTDVFSEAPLTGWPLRLDRLGALTQSTRQLLRFGDDIGAWQRLLCAVRKGDWRNAVENCILVGLLTMDHIDFLVVNKLMPETVLPKRLRGMTGGWTCRFWFLLTVWNLVKVYGALREAGAQLKACKKGDEDKRRRLKQGVSQLKIAFLNLLLDVFPSAHWGMLTPLLGVGPTIFSFRGRLAATILGAASAFLSVQRQFSEVQS